MARSMMEGAAVCWGVCPIVFQEPQHHVSSVLLRVMRLRKHRSTRFSLAADRRCYEEMLARRRQEMYSPGLGGGRTHNEVLGSPPTCRDYDAPRDLWME